MIGIYQITNLINGKKYIGQSNNIQKRWQEHKFWANHINKNNLYLYNAMNKYGVENFEFSIIEECELDQLDEREEYWIAQYHTYINDPQNWGYNLTPGGANHSHQKISVDQYDLQGNFIQSFAGVDEASQLTSTNISNLIAALKGRQQQSNNFQWRYHGEPAPGSIINTVKDNHYWSSSKKMIDQYNKDGQYIATYSSAHEAARAINKKCANHITECCLNKRKSAAGFVWKYSKILEV